MAWQRGRSYSQDLRERVLESDGLTCAQAAKRYSVSISYVVKARARRDRTGVLTTKQRGYRRPALVSGYEAEIVAEVERRPSITLAELRAWLRDTRGVSISMGTVWNVVRRLGLTLKKVDPRRRAIPRGCRGRPRQMASPPTPAEARTLGLPR
jgi:putative transposase